MPLVGDLIFKLVDLDLVSSIWFLKALTSLRIRSHMEIDLFRCWFDSLASSPTDRILHREFTLCYLGASLPTIHHLIYDQKVSVAMNLF